MQRIASFGVALAVVLLVAPATGARMTYSTGAVASYVAGGCGGPDLPATIPEASAFRAWYDLAGYNNFSRWNDKDVWGSDFRDGAGNDLEPQGGSGIPNIYYFTGHGSCQNPPTASTPDFILTCSANDGSNTTNIGQSTRWGNDNLRFAFLDASCPMDLVSLPNQWFPAFQGLHVATGHSGTSSSDTLDSINRGAMFASLSAGPPLPLGWLIPAPSIGDAWMASGIIEVQSGCCAVATAAGATEGDAVNRRENERLESGWSNPPANWLAWKWVCQ
jgi:hypothetical protein